MEAAEQLATDVGTAAACRALGLSRASLYRRRRPAPTQQRVTPQQPRALSDLERQTVLDTLHSTPFVDQAPAAVYAALLDQGTYLCSVRTMYRILDDAQEVRERRNQLRHPNYKKPELLATAPNQVWSWDITKLLGPAKWTYYYLYVILDIYSRYTVGWMLASREAADLAKRLIAETIAAQQADPQQLTIHSDRGPSMKSHGVAQLLASLGVTKSHSRPHVSNDNPFSESHFKTMKYLPDFPDRFGSYQHAHDFCGGFFHWYNHQHYHSGIAMLTPAIVHYGQAQQVLAARQQTLLDAYAAHPERFVRKQPSPPQLPEAVWINPPHNLPTEQQKKAPETLGPQSPDAPSEHPRPSYPSASCFPAELDSVSPGNSILPITSLQNIPSDTRVMPEKIPGVWGLAPTNQQLGSPSETSLH